ncbi:MAG: hypothetical protein EOO36_10485, partial [Cytophagaceae bacterium]
MLPQLFILERLRQLRASAPAPQAALATEVAAHPAIADAHMHTPEPAESGVRRQVISIIYLVAGVFSAALALEAFILPNGLFDGGVTGISLLAARLIHLPLSVFLV